MHESILKKDISVQNNRVHAKFLGNMYFQERNTNKERNFDIEFKYTQKVVFASLKKQKTVDYLRRY
jgi:hypothetical protein